MLNVSKCLKLKASFDKHISLDCLWNNNNIIKNGITFIRNWNLKANDQLYGKLTDVDYYYLFYYTMN